ncbi:hypothetical protein C8Q80DRAFT_1269975 [Daedaleopsis nitida]|nr:hypothetical protein C8Q80DRAFT_1269975 [Daedaleopsis nitida]
MATDQNHPVFPPFYEADDDFKIDLNPPDPVSAIERRNADLLRMGFGYRPKICVPPSPDHQTSPTSSPIGTTGFPRETEETTAASVETSLTSEADEPIRAGSVGETQKYPQATILADASRSAQHRPGISIAADMNSCKRGQEKAGRGYWAHMDPRIDSHQKVYFTFRMSIGSGKGRSRTSEQYAGPPGLNSDNEDSMFTLIPDTGSNTTWVLGEGYHIVPMNKLFREDSETGSCQDGDQPTTFAQPDFCSAFSADWIFHSALPDFWHLYRFQGQPDNSASLTGKVSHYDGSTASLAIGHGTQQGSKFSIENSHMFNVKDSEPTREMSGTYKFAVAYCIDEIVYRRPEDGLLGLGLSRCQDAFAGSMEEARAVLTIPSFLHDLVRQRKLPRSTKTHGEDATAIHICFHPQGSEVPSWISFNGFPPVAGITQPLKWKGPIQVTDYGIQHRQWAIRMVKIKVLDWELNAESGEYVLKKSPRAELDFTNAPVDAIIDTGASVSFVPSNIISFMRTEVFGTWDNRALNEERGDGGADLIDLKPEYKIRIDDPEYNVANMVVVVYFDNLRGELIPISLPADPFLCTQDTGLEPQEYEGLLFAHPNSKPDKRMCILGINFLQATIVSLINPSIQGRRPEVYLAAQWTDARKVEPVL